MRRRRARSPTTGAIPKAWTARFGRTVAETHVEAVRGRMGADRSPGFSGTLRGPAAAPEREAGTAGTDASPAGRLRGRCRPGPRPTFEDGAADDAIMAFRSFLAGDGEGADGPETTGADGGRRPSRARPSSMITRDGPGPASPSGSGAARPGPGFSGRDGDDVRRRRGDGRDARDRLEAEGRAVRDHPVARAGARARMTARTRPRATGRRHV